MRLFEERRNLSDRTYNNRRFSLPKLSTQHAQSSFLSQDFLRFSKVKASTSITTTREPLEASFLTVAAPIPPEPPVTTMISLSHVKFALTPLLSALRLNDWLRRNRIPVPNK